MLNKKIIIIIILASLFAISTVYAQDNVTCDNDVANYDNNENISEVEPPKSFSELNELINNNTDSNIYLHHCYSYDESTDSGFKDGIVINRPLNLFGNGNKIDASNSARIFNIVSTDVFINGITFLNGNAVNGGAITGGSYGVIRCTFTGNHADNYGGAMYNGHAENCLFKNNYALYGAAIYNGTVEKSNFESNNASYGGAIYDTYAYDSTFTNNVALVSSGAMEGGSANNCTFTRNSAKSYGAASKAFLLNCQFTNNFASTIGGAIGGSGCSADNCTFVNNYATNEGGAVYMAYVTNSEFRDNHANYGGAISGNVNSVVNSIFINNYANEMGGALANVYAVDCEFRRNHAHEGGAMYGSSAKNCTFISNYATESSGAIKGYAEDCQFVDNSAYRAGAIEGDAKNSRFEENHAVTGGAMYANSAENCIFIKNYADEGGAIYGGSAVLCTFVENHAKTGGAMYSGSAVSSNFTRNVAEISGGAHYRSSIVNCHLYDNLPKYLLEVSDFEAIYGFGGEIKVQISDSQTYVKNIKTLVKIYDINNNVVFVSSCLSGGTCFVDLDLGEFTIVVSVEDSNYNVDPVTRYINIKKATSFYVVSVTATYGINNPLIVNLHDSDGSILKNAPVKVNVHGALKTYRTNNNGQVLVPTTSLSPGSYYVLVNYDGDSKYFKASSSATITVKKAKPNMIVSNMKYYAKEKTKKFYMILKDNLYRVMKNTKVTLKVKGKSYTAKTNSHGRATFKITKLKKKGKYTATVKYTGNGFYTALSKSAKITVKR